MAKSPQKARASRPSLPPFPTAAASSTKGPHAEAGRNNISVAVRIRPFTARELAEAGGAEAVLDVSGNTITARALDRFGLESEYAKEKMYGFDAIFSSLHEDSGECATQEQLFQEIGVPILDNAFNAYNGCLLAYGQTGAGKSHSILGDLRSAEGRGLLPRACERLFEMVERRRTEAEAAGTPLQAAVLASYLEIYQEKMFDLLVSARSDLQVRVHPALGPHVPELTEAPVASIREVRELLDFGAKRRAVASTAMNAGSSRSHAVFTVDLRLSAGPAGRGLQAKLRFVDLAGSEKQKRSGASGERLQEGIAINQSLSALSRVIQALVAPEGRLLPPFRESKLTLLLKDALSGNSRTALLACVSPARSNLEESVGTLEFASRCKLVRTHAKENLRDQRDLMEGLSAERQQVQEQLELEQRQRRALQDELEQELEASRRNQELARKMREEKLEVERQLRELEAQAEQELLLEKQRQAEELQRVLELQRAKDREVAAREREQREGEARERASEARRARDVERLEREKASELSRAEAERLRAVAELQERLAGVRRREEEGRRSAEETGRREAEMRERVAQELRLREKREGDLRRELQGLQSLSDSWVLERQDLERRAQEQKARRGRLLQSLGIVGMDPSDEEASCAAPRLVNLHPDPMLEGALTYYLTPGETRIGADQGRCRVCLTGLGIAEEVCAVVNDDDERLFLRPLPGGLVRVNGAAVAEAGLALAGGDRLAIGRAHIFRVVIPNGRRDADVDRDEEEFHRAMQELQACAEVDPRWQRSVDAAILTVKRDHGTREANELLDEARRASEVVAEANEILRLVPQGWAGVSHYELAVLFEADGPPAVCVVARRDDGGAGWEPGAGGSERRRRSQSAGIWEVPRFVDERLGAMQEVAEVFRRRPQDGGFLGDVSEARGSRCRPGAADWESRAWAEVPLHDYRELAQEHGRFAEAREEGGQEMDGSGGLGFLSWFQWRRDSVQEAEPADSTSSGGRLWDWLGRATGLSPVASTLAACPEDAQTIGGRLKAKAKEARQRIAAAEAAGDQASPSPIRTRAASLTGRPQASGESFLGTDSSSPLKVVVRRASSAARTSVAPAGRSPMHALAALLPRGGGDTSPTLRGSACSRDRGAGSPGPQGGRGDGWSGSTAAPSAGAAAVLPRRGTSQEEAETAEVRVGALFDGRLGVRLRMEGLVVSGFDVPEAEGLGWRVRDEIVAVNGRPVQTREEFRHELLEARKALPMVFTVRRPETDR